MAIYNKFLALVSGSARTVDLSTNTISLGGAQLNGATSGTFSQFAFATTSSYSVIWPSAQAAGANYALFNDGAGNLSWAPASAGANTSLSNLASVAINTSLLPGADNTINLGSASFSWASANIHALKDASGTTIDSYGRALVDSAAASQLSWSTSGVTFNQLTASTVPYLNASKVLTSSTVTPTELGYLSGVTSAIQTQLNGKLSLSGGTMTGTIDLGGFTPINSGTPVNPNDLVTKSYVDNFINATSWKTAALVATTANITLSGEQTIDGFLTSSSRVLVKNQTLSQNNGIYVSNSGAWTRAVDMSVWASVPAAAVFIQEGTVNADLGFVCVSQPGGTLGTTPITFVQFSSAGSYSADGITLQLISGVFSIKNAGVTETQIASSSFLSTGAIVGGSGTKISVQVDNSSIDINGSNQLEIKAAGVTTAKLGTITDGSTLDQSGAGSTLRVKPAGVSATQLATGAFDQVTIVGGAGTPASAASTPSTRFAGVAGQSFSANTTYAVRYGLPTNSETAGRIYAADITTSSHDLFWVIGFIQPTGAIVAGNAVTVIRSGSITLLSGDTNFVTNDAGTPVWLQASGAWSTTAPSTTGQAVAKLAIVTSTTTMDVQIGPVAVA